MNTNDLQRGRTMTRNAMYLQTLPCPIQQSMTVKHINDYSTHNLHIHSGKMDTSMLYKEGEIWLKKRISLLTLSCPTQQCLTTKHSSRCPPHRIYTSRAAYKGHLNGWQRGRTWPKRHNPVEPYTASSDTQEQQQMSSTHQIYTTGATEWALNGAQTGGTWPTRNAYLFISVCLLQPPLALMAYRIAHPTSH